MLLTTHAPSFRFGCLASILLFAKLKDSAATTSQGTNFWLAQMPNYITEDKFTITMINPSSTTNATVTIDHPHSSETQTVNVDPGSSTDAILAYRAVDSVGVTVSTQPVYHVTSDIEIAVFTASEQTGTDDGALILPTHGLGDHHLVPAYSAVGIDSSEYEDGAFFSALATEDDTNILVYDTSGVLQINETIDQGTMVQKQLATGDFSGMTGWEILSDKPVAVVAGSQCRSIGAIGCDHLLEQVLPEEVLDTEYIVCPMLDRPRDCSGTECIEDVFRIIATQNGTVASYSNIGRSDDTLSRGDFVTFLSNEPFSVSANEPVYVSQFQQSQSAGAQTGDPAFTMVPPVSQYLTSYAVDNSHSFDYDSMVFTVPSGTVLTIDGVDLPAITCANENAGNVDGVDYCCYTHDITSEPDGYHKVEADQPFAVVLHLYDFWYSSQAFLGGTGLECINEHYCNSPPVARCGSVIYSDDSSCFASLTESELISAIDNNSADPDGDILTFTVSETGPFPIGSTSVTLTVSDGKFQDECVATVTVIGVDTDGDSEPDCTDQCFEDPNKIDPMICGCGREDKDDNLNRLIDCTECQWGIYNYGTYECDCTDPGHGGQGYCRDPAGKCTLYMTYIPSLHIYACDVDEALSCSSAAECVSGICVNGRCEVANFCVYGTYDSASMSCDCGPAVMHTPGYCPDATGACTDLRTAVLNQQTGTYEFICGGMRRGLRGGGM